MSRRKRTMRSVVRRFSTTFAVVLCVAVMAANMVRANQIMVVDLDNLGTWDAYDFSTGGDTTNGLNPSASITGLNWQEAQTYWWNSAAPFFNTAQTATWTVSGYTPGAAVRVYVHWRDEGTQVNGDTAASYVVNGGTPVVVNQRVAPNADLTLNDGANDHDFELFAQYAADGDGQVQVVLSHGNNWTVADAVTFETVPPTPPEVTQPATTQLFETDTLTLTAIVTGFPVPTVQWKTNGVNVAGATSSTLVYPNIQLSESGLEWSCVAVNVGGTASDTTTVTVIEGTQIVVVDADDGSWAAYDGSTGTENTNGLTGTFISGGLAWGAASGIAWNGAHGGYAEPGQGDTATWTVTGYAPGAVVNVYTHWHHQHNTTPGLPYIVNGGTPVVKNQEATPPADDLALTDPQPISQPFELIGQYVADGAGQVQVAIGDPQDGTGDHDFGNVDAIAFQTDASMSSLSISSLYGTPDPAFGSHVYANGTVVTASVDSAVENGTTQHVCTGWAGTGSVSGSGTSNQTSFMIGAISSMTWQWGTNFYLNLTENAGGTTDIHTGWVALGSSITVTAYPTNGGNVAWSGDTNGTTVAGNQISWTMGAPRSLTVDFPIPSLPSLTVVSAHDGADPETGVLHQYSPGATVDAYVTNSPVTSGTTRYICMGWSRIGSEPGSGSGTHTSFIIDDDTTLTWQWRTDYYLTVTEDTGGTTDVHSGWITGGSNITVTAFATNGGGVAWSGDTNGTTIVGDQISWTMGAARSITASFPDLVLIGPGVNNGDFEATDVVVPTTFISGTIPSWANWTEIDTADDNTGIYDSPAGSQAAYLQAGGAVRNMTTHTIAEGQLFTYSFDSVRNAAATMELVYDDGGVITAIPGTAITGGPVNTYSNSLIVYAGDAWIGREIGVGFTGAGGWPEFDNILLSKRSAPPTAPTVTLPATAQVFESDTLTLTATVTGYPAPTFQWKTNGANVAGATANPLVYNNIQLSESGLEWSCEVTNGGGSDVATTTVTVVRGAQIMVVDADNGSWTAYDRSTGAESTSSLAGSFTSSGIAWPQGFTELWNSSAPGHTSGGGASATWIVNGYAPRTVVNVYAHWRGQSNASAAAPYSVNGRAAVTKNHKLSPLADLSLTDPRPTPQNFELLGHYTPNGAGQVVVVLTHSGYCNVDAIAFKTLPWIKIEDFENHVLGSEPSSANGWVERGGSADDTVVIDPEFPAGKVAKLLASGNAGYNIPLGVDTIRDGQTGTLFFRTRSVPSTSFNFGAYLTDWEWSSGIGWWNQDDAGFYARNTQGDGTALRPRWDAGSIHDVEGATWYNVWVVADNSAKTFSLYISRGADNATGGVTSEIVDTGVAFGGTGGDLDYFMFLGVAAEAASGGMIDDIYMSEGENLVLPSGAIHYNPPTLFILK